MMLPPASRLTRKRMKYALMANCSPASQPQSYLWPSGIFCFRQEGAIYDRKHIRESIQGGYRRAGGQRQDRAGRLSEQTALANVQAGGCYQRHLFERVSRVLIPACLRTRRTK